MSKFAMKEALRSIAQEQHRKRIVAQRWIGYREYEVGVILPSVKFWKADMVREAR